MEEKSVQYIHTFPFACTNFRWTRTYSLDCDDQYDKYEVKSLHFRIIHCFSRPFDELLEPTLD